MAKTGNHCFVISMLTVCQHSTVEMLRFPKVLALLWAIYSDYIQRNSIVSIHTFKNKKTVIIAFQCEITRDFSHSFFFHIFLHRGQFIGIQFIGWQFPLSISGMSFKSVIAFKNQWYILKSSQKKQFGLISKWIRIDRVWSRMKNEKQLFWQ